jgi:DNA-binding XRE family transcriptional regulator
LRREEYDEQARKLCLLGATDAELADFFGVSEQTLNTIVHVDIHTKL